MFAFSAREWLFSDIKHSPEPLLFKKNAQENLHLRKKRARKAVYLKDNP